MVTLEMHTKHQFIIWTEFLFEVYLKSNDHLALGLKFNIVRLQLKNDENLALGLEFSFFNS